MTPTPMFKTIAEYARVEPHQAQTWWTALTKAQWSVPRSWLADVRYFDQQHRSRTAQLDGVVPFLRTTSPPSRVMAVLEALVQEQRLTRPEASTIQARVLAFVDARGAWVWSP